MRERPIVPRGVTELPENGALGTPISLWAKMLWPPPSRGPHNRSMEPVTLSTERLLLRPLAPGDAGAVLAACQDPEIQRWTGVPSPYLPEHARTFAGKVVPAAWASDTEYVFGAFLADPGRRGGAGDLAACLGLKPRGQDTFELGFWAVKEHRGRGHVTEAALALCRWAFDALGAARVEWRAGLGNDASRAVADRCGFVHEGVLRQAILTGGVRHDAWIASLLPADLDERAPAVGAAL